jgi:hypothetical protein
MNGPVSSRGTQDDHMARPGRKAPLSGRQGALVDEVTRLREERPADTIAVARKTAEELA